VVVSRSAGGLQGPPSALGDRQRPHQHGSGGGGGSKEPSEYDTNSGKSQVTSGDDNVNAIDRTKNSCVAVTTNPIQIRQQHQHRRLTPMSLSSK